MPARVSRRRAEEFTMPKINDCRRIDIHPVGVEGAFDFPIQSSQLLFIAKLAAEGLAQVRAVQALPAVVRDKMNDLRADYSCANPRCKNLRMRVDQDSAKFKLIHTEPRGAVWHAHFRLEANVLVRCGGGNPGETPPEVGLGSGSEQQQGSESGIGAAAGGAPWAAGGAADRLASSIADAILDGGTNDCDC
jgi:hypothetical protein